MSCQPSIPRICEQCGAHFLAWRGNVGRFCGRACYQASRTSPKVTTHCLNCGKPITVFEYKVRTGRAKYCSSSCKCKHRTGPLAPHWKGGNSHRPGNVPWSRAVMQRDNFTCQRCGKRGGKLHAHHIYSYKSYPELRGEVSNGITFCVPCHRAIHRGEPIQLGLL